MIPDERPVDDQDRPVYVISVAAELAGMHPQTLRTYDRLGLVSPGRAGRARRYSARDVELLREVSRLSQQEGVGLSGVRRILALQRQVESLAAQVNSLSAELAAARAGTSAEVARVLAEQASAARRDLVPLRPTSGQQVVVWRRRRP
jgi:MerR family transcriptional regulator/heat shock protein HspR